MIRVRKTMLEDIHAGIEPVSHTGDFTDVVVIDANGRRIAWPEVSRTRELVDAVLQRLGNSAARNQRGDHEVART